jgi:hypothetical protein
MSKHTPGPWGWHTPATTAARYPCYVTAGNQYIAAIYHGDDQRETHPNARLIAAAPELLEALQLITEVGNRAATEIAHAAIAKATGEAA